jgi:uncharacterized protein YkwD
MLAAVLMAASLATASPVGAQELGMLSPVATASDPGPAAAPAAETPPRRFGVLRRVAPRAGSAEARVAELVNAARADAGLPALRWDARLADAASDYAATMGVGGFFSHTGPGGERLTDRAEAAGYLDWSFLGENLAAGQPTPERVVAAWMASQTHRANVLAAEACRIGVGHAAAAQGRYDEYWVMEIGC